MLGIVCNMLMQKLCEGTSQSNTTIIWTHTESERGTNAHEHTQKETERENICKCKYRTCLKVESHQ